MTVVPVPRFRLTRKLTILGATGSSALDRGGDPRRSRAFETVAVAAEATPKIWPGRAVAGREIRGDRGCRRYTELKAELAGTNIAARGAGGMREAASMESDLVVGAIAGAAGVSDYAQWRRARRRLATRNA